MNGVHGTGSSINAVICPERGTSPYRCSHVTHRRPSGQVRRPAGAPVPADFEFVTQPVPRPDDGQVLVDPYMRQLMDMGGWELGAGLEGRVIGRVVASRARSLPEGTVVF